MKSKSTMTGKKVEPLVMLHGRVLYLDRQGEINDVTHEDDFGLKKFAENGALALYILNQCKKRLDLLFLAAEHRSHVDARLVQLAVEDVRSELQEGSELAGYVHLVKELFEHSQALFPTPLPDTRHVCPSLTIVKPS